jgi:hypothetical protein
MAGLFSRTLGRVRDTSWASRRRRDRLLLLLAVLVVGGVAAVGALSGDAERIGAYWTSAELDAGGRAEIVEVIDYDFGSWPRQRHGILRDIPGVDRDAGFVVSSPTAPDRVRITSGFGEVNLRIGDPSVTINNRHRYRIEYPLGTLVQGDIVSWNGVGTGWVVPIDEVEIHLVAPYELDNPICDRGRQSAVGGCEAVEVAPGHLMVTTGGLSDLEGVTVTAERGATVAEPPIVPAAPTGPADDPGFGWLLPALLAAAAAVVGIVLTWPLIRRLGREQVWPGGAVAAAYGPAADAGEPLLLDHRQLAELATIEFEPPDDLGPARGGVIYDEHVRPQHKIAWLVERANRGEVVLDVGGGDSKLTRGDQWPEPDTAATLTAMFGGRSSVRLGTYDSKFAAAWAGLERRLEAWRLESGLWDPAGRKRRTTARVLGLVFGAIGLVVAGGGGALANRGAVVGLVVAAVGGIVAGIGLTATTTSWELPVRTPEGSALWLQLESFRRFIAASEAKHAEAAASMGLLLHYTAWAVALDEVDHWEQAVNAAAAGGALGAMSQSDLMIAGRAGRLSGEARSTSVAPSSSGGGGGFGGGGAGGGGGGGGGGSW